MLKIIQLISTVNQNIYRKRQTDHTKENIISFTSSSESTVL